MTVMISQTLRTKIERRSQRAFRRFDEGEDRKIHRISGVSKNKLRYRIARRRSPRTIDVARDDNGTIVVDPPTTGLVDVLKRTDAEKLNNHAGEVRAYLLADKKKKNKTYKPKKPEGLLSREACVDSVKEGQFVYVVELMGDEVDTVSSQGFTATSFTVTDELDSEKDLGFTTGLLDCLSKADVVSLGKKKHLGQVRAYKYVTKDAKSPTRSGSEAITYKVGEKYEIKDADTGPGSNCHKGINVADIEWAKKSCYGDSRLFAFEFDMKDIAAIPTNTDGKFRLHKCLCVEELDPKTLKPIKPAKKAKEAKPKAVKKVKKVKKAKKKKKGFFDKLLGRGDD